jgi:hypothetical protein
LSILALKTPSTAIITISTATWMSTARLRPASRGKRSEIRQISGV